QRGWRGLSPHQNRGESAAGALTRRRIHCGHGRLLNSSMMNIPYHAHDEGRFTALRLTIVEAERARIGMLFLRQERAHEGLVHYRDFSRPLQVVAIELAA